jgi:hypothetical protein
MEQRPGLVRELLDELLSEVNLDSDEVSDAVFAYLVNNKWSNHTEKWKE